MEADFVRAVDRVFADRIDGVDELIAGCRAAADTVRPFLDSSVAGLASFVAVHSFDFDAVRRWQDWATAYHERAGGPFSVMYSYCMAGIASHEQPAVARAEDEFRHVLRLGRESGLHRYPARLAGVLLGALLYEKGALGDAERVVMPAMSTCIDVGLPRLVLDAGAQIPGLVAAVLEDMKSGDDPIASRSNLTDSSLGDLLHT
jgi:serine/threonine-protein kinase PknK